MNERIGLLITALTIVTQSGLYLISGGFSVGSKVADMNSEIKLLRNEVVSQNQIQDYRLDKLEGSKNPTK
jgi:hypothetical protein